MTRLGFPADLDPATLGRMSPDDLRMAATWLLDGYEYDPDDGIGDEFVRSLARVGNWLLAEADRRDREAAVRRLARKHSVPQRQVRAAFRAAEAGGM